MSTKKCSKCLIIKPFSAFYRHKKKKNGINSNCKLCSSAENKAWRKLNKEKQKINKKVYYIENKQKSNADSKKWRQNNPKKAKVNHKNGVKIIQINLKISHCYGTTI